MTYALMALVALLAIALLTRPWWRGTGPVPVRRRATNVAAYRGRLAEIQADLDGGLLEPAAADALRQEMEAQLLRDAASDEAVAPAARAGNAKSAALLALALLLFGAGGYFVQGSWRDQVLIDTAKSDPAAAQALAIQGMVAGLEQRLQAQPGDAEGWAMLGRSKVVLKDFAAAASAYARANEISAQKNPDWLVGEGEALALARDRDLLGTPRQRFELALTLDPMNPRALWYAGLAAAQAQDYQAARGYWTSLREQDIPAELRTVLDERLQAIAQLAGEAPATAAAPASATPAAAAVTLKLRVRLADAVAAQRKPGQILFVFAKAVSGPPMPLAVQRLAAATLPMELTLDDSMGMLPQLRLSQFDQWVVTARLSSSGDVKGEPGDLEGTLNVTRAQAAAPIELVIDQVRR